MHATQAAVLATLRNVQQFLDDRKEELAGVDLGAGRKNVDDLVVQLTTQSIDQIAGMTHRISETARQGQLRAALRVGQMKPIAEVARATLRESPQLKPFLLPAPKTPSTQLIAIAESMGEQAKNYEQVFIQGGLPRDFLAQLSSASEALLTSLLSRAHGKSRAVGATTALAPLARRGRGALRVLDALITPKIALNDRLLGEWKAVKAIPTKRGPARSRSADPNGDVSTPVTLIVSPVVASPPAAAPPVSVPPAATAA
jgi:hypothetical protein